MATKSLATAFFAMFAILVASENSGFAFGPAPLAEDEAIIEDVQSNVYPRCKIRKATVEGLYAEDKTTDVYEILLDGVVEGTFITNTHILAQELRGLIYSEKCDVPRAPIDYADVGTLMNMKPLDFIASIRAKPLNGVCTIQFGDQNTYFRYYASFRGSDYRDGSSNAPRAVSLLKKAILAGKCKPSGGP